MLTQRSKASKAPVHFQAQEVDYFSFLLQDSWGDEEKKELSARIPTLSF